MDCVIGAPTSLEDPALTCFSEGWSNFVAPSSPDWNLMWRYTVQATPTLFPCTWSNVPPYTNMEGVGPLTVTNAFGGTTQMFYRLLATPGS